MHSEKRTLIVRSEVDRRKYHSIRYFLEGGVERRKPFGERRKLAESVGEARE